MFELIADSVMTLETALMSGLTGLAAVVAYLWSFITKHVAELRISVKDCEEDREALWAKLLEQKSSCDCK